MSDLRDQLAGAVEAFDELQGISGGYKARALAAEAEVSRLAAALGVSASADGPPDLADCRWTSSCSSVSTCLNRGALVTDLVTFLLNRLADDERAARAAGSGPWQWEQKWGGMCNDPDCEYGQLFQQKDDDGLCLLMEVHGYDVRDDGWSGAEHIARWDPARVLAECASKRRIIGLWNLQMSTEWPPGGRPQPLGGMGAEVYYDALLALAAVYSSHPEFDPAWEMT